jgi:hypothetical protein
MFMTLRFGVALVAVQSDGESDPLSTIKLNAGPDYIMKKNDICYYMSISKEENSSLMVNNPMEESLNADDDLARQLSKVANLKKGSIQVSKFPGRPKGRQPFSKI